MTIRSSLDAGGGLCTIAIEGRFDFSQHQQFRDAYETAEQSKTAFVVDMAQTTYIDSSALGMLLLLRDYAGGDRQAVKITNCNDDVKKIFAISNFEKLFDIN